MISIKLKSFSEMLFTLSPLISTVLPVYKIVEEKNNYQS